MGGLFCKILYFGALIAGLGAAAEVEKRQLPLSAATIDLTRSIGAPLRLGSGVLYGIPLNNPNNGLAQTTIPQSFLTGMGFNFARSGGDGWPAPNRGYTYGVNEYRYRFQDALTHYRTVRQFGGGMFLLLSGLWGLDGNPAMPGDGGNWSQYDAFLTQLIYDIKANRMQNGLIIEIWNEPDSIAWPRDKAQHLLMWGRGVARLRAELPGVPIGGPSISYGPDPQNPTFTNWASFVARNNTVPDVYVWHALSGGRTPTNDLAYFNQQRQQFGLPSRPINLNEYLAYEEEGPSFVAWYLSQLERLNMRGLKANWGKGGQTVFSLHNYLANSLGPEGANGNYYGNGEYGVYKYYATNMTGRRVLTTSSLDQRFEVFATVNGPTVKLLTSARSTTERYNLRISGWSTLGIQGRIALRVWAFRWNGVFGDAGKPEDLGGTILPINGDVVTFEVRPRTTQEAYAFELTQG